MKMGVPAKILGLPIVLLLLNGLLLAPQWLRTGSLGPGWIAIESLLVVGLSLCCPPALECGAGSLGRHLPGVAERCGIRGCPGPAEPGPAVESLP